ncbi:hypothetical protein C4J89_4207 [Pseudomonas sp. R4-35-07]|nr:hypothetical protein C4J90_4192 [Pseudomonas sp. R2-60-08W]AZF33654.1 hypothetical protein C4J89_4207 [Pseudomonas sp. R4-35-07]
MLAKNVNDNAVCLVIRGVLRFFASKLAPAGYLSCGVIYLKFVLSQCLASSFRQCKCVQVLKKQLSSRIGNLRSKH